MVGLTCPAHGRPGASEVPRQCRAAGEPGETGEWVRGCGADEHRGSSDQVGKSTTATVRHTGARSALILPIHKLPWCLTTAL